MWIGGVRVIVPNGDGKILMVCQRHEGREIWMAPGGGIEAGEDARAAAVREIREETGLCIRIRRLLWHVEEVSEARGQRFVNFFLAEPAVDVPQLGSDPELDAARQVLMELKFVDEQEMRRMSRVYPEWMRTELWPALKEDGHDPFRIRT